MQRPVGGYTITVYHTMHDEVNNYRQHWWECERCGNIVKRAMNRPPQEADCRGRMGRGFDCADTRCMYHMHVKHCGGTYKKIKEPEKQDKKGKRSVKVNGQELVGPTRVKRVKTSGDGETAGVQSITNFFSTVTPSAGKIAQNGDGSDRKGQSAARLLDAHDEQLPYESECSEHDSKQQQQQQQHTRQGQQQQQNQQESQQQQQQQPLLGSSNEQQDAVRQKCMAAALQRMGIAPGPPPLSNADSSVTVLAADKAHPHRSAVQETKLPEMAVVDLTESDHAASLQVPTPASEPASYADAGDNLDTQPPTCPVCCRQWQHGEITNAELNAHLDECLTLMALRSDG